MRLPEGAFSTVVADPPWHYGSANQRSSAAYHSPNHQNP